MPDLDDLTDDQFRMQVRGWIEANYPAEIRNPPQSLALQRQQALVHEAGPARLARPKLAEGIRRHGHLRQQAAHFPGRKGTLWLCPPERHGHDHDRSAADQVRPTRPATVFPAQNPGRGTHLVPGLQRAQRRLRPRLACAPRRCLDGDHWVVNGQKIWTSLAMDANWIFLLVRTDKQAKKQDGISFLLVPMDSPGITVRPITNIDMADEFCETFFDNVRVPKDNLVGQINKGWTMAKALLGFERIGSGSPRQSSYALEAAEAAGRTYGRVG